ncbi:ARM repeat-containing protein [Ascodesmis nigricans]|uniref:ARM repeat-containing protein n=1 Tax=Ascodesmis nigricans TaxID=341454 RepID=A0A4S2N0E1_9PEZI|nr:ARM repeat-containing protein [Ascodesmis nigricans]
MESKLLSILDQTLQNEDEPRRTAESQLEALYPDSSFPVALVNIAAAAEAPLVSRKTALTTLKRYVNRCWSAGFEEFTGPLTPGEVKTHIKRQMFSIITSDLRQVRSIAAAIVGKIAVADYPDEWPELLPTLLKLISDGNDAQASGALHVLGDVIEEGLGDDLFLQLAEQIVELLYSVATAKNKSFSVRSLATSTFKSCIDTLGTLLGGDETNIVAFAHQAINHWVPFIINALEAPLPADVEDRKGMLALKIQAIKTVTQAKIHFPRSFDESIERLFAATWSDMNLLKERYVAEFVREDTDGKLVNADGLPYSLDLYVLEQIDFIQTCLGTKVVRDRIEQAGFDTAGGSPFSQMMFTTVMLSQIGGEDRMMWEADLNVFLSEECAVSANYTPRTACGDLALKLFECFPDRTLQALYDHTQSVFRMGAEGAYVKEAALYLWDQLLHEIADREYPVDENLAKGLLQLIVQAMCDESDDFLRARGYAAAATLTEAACSSIRGQVTELMEQSIRAATSDKSPVVEICAIRSFQKYCHSVSGEQLRGFQVGIITAIRMFMDHKGAEDLDDAQDVLAELVETIQAAAGIDHGAVLNSNLQVPELLFKFASLSTNNYHIHGLVEDTFDSIIRGLRGNYIPLCERILPLLIPMLEEKPDKSNHELVALAESVLAHLIDNGTTPLPQGFVATVMPHLTRVLSTSVDTDIVSEGAKALTYILNHDVAQLLNYQSPIPDSKSGLEMTLIIIDRLLRPDITEATAAEVGTLAGELVVKAGDKLGQLLPGLLGAVAGRLINAAYPPFVQSLSLVFARLIQTQAKDVVDFLQSLTIAGRNGLEAVLSTWLGHTTIFTGYDDIYQNILALCHLYNLQDPRLNNIYVQGDLIVPETSRIMTRSRARANPDRYTSIPVPVKILKLLTQELGPNVEQNMSAVGGRGLVGTQQNDPEDEDEWEDLPEVPGMTRDELLALGGSGRTSRQIDDEVYGVLIGFFKEVMSKNIGNFQELYNQLTPEEQRILSLIH